MYEDCTHPRLQRCVGPPYDLDASSFERPLISVGRSLSRACACSHWAQNHAASSRMGTFRASYLLLITSAPHTQSLLNSFQAQAIHIARCAQEKQINKQTNRAEEVRVHTDETLDRSTHPVRRSISTSPTSLLLVHEMESIRLTLLLAQDVPRHLPDGRVLF